MPLRSFVKHRYPMLFQGYSGSYCFLSTQVQLNSWLLACKHPIWQTRRCSICSIFIAYSKRVMTSDAETGLVPPANGVIVSAVGLPAGQRTVNILFITVVVINVVPTI